MDSKIKSLFADRESPDRDTAYKAVIGLFEAANKPVKWAYDVWDQLLEQLSDREGHTRAFAAQMLARLAISDPEGRMLRDFPKIAAVMNDDKTVTARHTLQSLWRIGVAGPRHAKLVASALERRFRECGDEKGARIVRTDAITALRKLADATKDKSIEARVGKLIESEPDEKARKKQQAAWRTAGA